MEIQVSKAGEIDVLAIRGDVAGTDVPELAGRIQEILNAQGLCLVLDLERVGVLCPAALAAFGELATKLGRAGGTLALGGATPQNLGEFHAALKANPDVVVAESRGLALSVLLNRLSVRGQLLGFIREALATTYVAPHAPHSPVTCRFVKHMQNFLVYALEPPYDGSLAKGMTLRFTMTGCGEKGTQTVSFDGLLYRFGTLKDGAPCLIVKVPDLLEIVEDRREDPRIRVRFQATWWEKGRPHQKGYATLEDLSIGGGAFRTGAFPYKAGAMVMLEPDFRNWKLTEPIGFEIAYVRADGGDTLVGGRFIQINANDKRRIDNMILESSKW